jgi:SAM-dependent methyltransferase
MSEVHACPHCGVRMYAIDTPWESSWGGETHHVCFNDSCKYFVNSWNALDCQGIDKTGYRCRIDARGTCGPMPVHSATDLKHLTYEVKEEKPSTKGDFLPDDFSREDEDADNVFYQTPRFVSHLDEVALSTVEDLYSRLIPEGTRVLDLMAGPDSHVKEDLRPAALVGLGLNCEELEANTRLSERIVHDVNCCPNLPFEDHAFDVVINTVSVDYLTRPVEVFKEVARILKPGGMFVVVFSSRMFPTKAVKLWKKSSEPKRVDLVKKYFDLAGSFSPEGYFESKGKPRPKDDKYYAVTPVSDPVYAVWSRVTKS